MAEAEPTSVDAMDQDPPNDPPQSNDETQVNKNDKENQPNDMKVDANATTNTNTNTNENENKTQESQQKEQKIDENNDEKEQKSDDIDLLRQNTHGVNPMMLLQSAMTDFTNEMSAASMKAQSLYEDHLERQQNLLKQFVADSVRLMHEHNTQLDPIHDVLKKLKHPLDDVLLNQYIELPCDSLDSLTQKHGRHTYKKTWGVTPLTHQYNEKHQISDNPQLQYMSLGPEIESMKAQTMSLLDHKNSKENHDTNNTNNNNDNTNNDDSNKNNEKDDDQDTTMTDENETIDGGNSNLNDKTIDIENEKNKKMQENDLYTQAIYGYLSNLDNITASQIDLVLKKCTAVRAAQLKIEAQKQAKLQALQRVQRQKEQRTAGAQTLCTFLPWLTTEHALCVMEMKDDNLDQATNYCMTADPADLYLQMNEWKKKHQGNPNATSATADNDGDAAMINDLRSQFNKRVLNRSQSTGYMKIKCVIFQCTHISNDGQITLKSVLDRNQVPLAPGTAKLLHLSVTDLMAIDDAKMVSPTMVHLWSTERVLQIVFQVIKDKPPPAMNLDMNAILSTINIPDSILNTNDIEKIQEYARKFMESQQQTPVRKTKKETEFLPISFQPVCRDLEYELKFDDKPVPSNACLTAVVHRTDGPVLFRGIMDDGSGMLASTMNSPVEIYTQELSDCTHNIVCIIIDNDMREEIVVDVKNITNTEVTLQECKKESEEDFKKKDAAGNKISYRLIVKDKRIIAVLIQFANEIKEMPFIEHPLPNVGDMVSIPSRSMLGIVKCIPTGLIVTNDESNNIERINVTYPKNVNSVITRKHCADLDGFIDIDVVREGKDGWRKPADPLKQSFAVIDLLAASDNDLIAFMEHKENFGNELMGDISEAIKVVEDAFANLNDKKSEKDSNSLLNDCISSVKSIQEMMSKMKNGKNEFSVKEQEFLKVAQDKVMKYNREIRTLKFEIKMK